MIIFGATGDLAKRKLVPAIFALRCFGAISTHCEVIGTGRTPLSGKEFRARMRAGAMAGKGPSIREDPRWRGFAKRVRYFTGDPTDPGFYPRLAAELERRRQGGGSANYLFYVATPSSLAPPIIEGLRAVGLAHKKKGGWSRIVLEKPFGHDLRSARKLNRVARAAFPEEAIFRIDHYLGKESVENLLVFRFGNTLFDAVWNRKHIEYVEITAAESLGVEHRAPFYEKTGALRDMVANHMLQLLTLTAMGPPGPGEKDGIRDEKVRVLRAIRPMTVKEVGRRTARGQYGAGNIDAKPVVGYRDEPDVGQTSQVETFAAVEFHVDNERWAGVPFFVRTGKRLGTKLTEIRVHFRRTTHLRFAAPGAHPDTNLVTIRIQPDEGIDVTFAAKEPGTDRPVPVAAAFAYATTFPTKLADPYTTLLLDAIRGDGSHFTRRDEVEAAWRIITPIETAWAELPPPRFPNYAAGSGGPAAARALTHPRALHAL